MRCPRCQLGDVSAGDTCPTCGFVVSGDGSPEQAMLAELERVARGELEGQFDIDRLLGRGGMSVVLLGRESELKRYVAIKVLPLQLTFAPDAAERFKREARIAASLDHPHIVPIYRVGSTPRLMWYSMKYVRGATLATHLAQEGPMRVETTVRFIAKVADALQFAHDKGVVHRDVKPGNFMLDERGWAWVTDFGVAKAFGSVPLTQTGGALGTPGYMSPEQCYGMELDGRSDQYALGVVAYECLTGAPPFVAQSVGEYIHKHCHVPAPDIRSVREDVPDRIATALLTALSKTPGERFSTVTAFARALGAPEDLFVLPRVSATTTIETPHTAHDADEPTTPITPTPAEPVRAGGRKASPGHVAALVAALVIVLIGTLALPGGGAPATGASDSVPAAPDRDSLTGPAQPDTNGMAVLLVSSSPVGLLSIDGRPAGESYRPEGIPVRAGRRVLRITREGHLAWVDTIDVFTGDTVRRVGVALRSIE